GREPRRLGRRREIGHCEYALRPDGRQLATCNRMDTDLVLQDLDGGSAARTLRIPLESRGLCYSPDGPRMAVGGWPAPAGRVLETASGAELLTLRGHPGEVIGVRFSADGRQVAAAGNATGVTLWDVATGQIERTLEAGRNCPGAIDFSPNGHLLAVGCV